MHFVLKTDSCLGSEITGYGEHSRSAQRVSRVEEEREREITQKGRLGKMWERQERARFSVVRRPGRRALNYTAIASKLISQLPVVIRSRESEGQLNLYVHTQITNGFLSITLEEQLFAVPSNSGESLAVGVCVKTVFCSK